MSSIGIAKDQVINSPIILKCELHEFSRNIRRIQIIGAAY